VRSHIINKTHKMTPKSKDSWPGNPSECERVLEESRPPWRKWGRARRPDSRSNAQKWGLNLKVMIHMKASALWCCT